MCRGGDHTCSPYSCQPGCTIGDQPGLTVPNKSGVKVPWLTKDEEYDEECFVYFNCTKDPDAPEDWDVQLDYQYCEKQDRCIVGNHSFGECIYSS